MASRHCVSARALTAALLLGCASPVTAQVRALVLGIDVNCPPGLAECWGVGIREGVARMPEIATVAQEADGDAQTATIHPQDGRLISLEALERHVASIQMGARLRAVEAVIDGWLERQEGRPVLRMGNSDEPLPLAPLTEKAQFDRRKGRAFSATDRERDAHQSLLATWSGERQPVRIVGPLRASAPDGSLSIEVREVFPFSTTPLPGALFVLGLRVNSPYGLGERWSELRECLLRFPAIEHVADTPAGDSSTVTIRTRDGQIPDLPALNAHLHSAALGAEATGIEATVEGRLTRWQGRLALKISGSDQPLPLAGLVSKIQWDHRQQHAMPASLMERNACDRLAGRSTFLSPRMRVTGPVVRTPDGQWALLEVREFDPNPRVADSRAAGTRRDATPPAPVAAPGAVIRPDGSVLVSWDRSTEPDVAGYNLYRSAHPRGRFVKLNRSLLTFSEFLVARSRTATDDHYAVTVVDLAGNESTHSPATDARPPATPAGFSVTRMGKVVRLEWEPVAADDLDSYSVRRSETPGGPYAVITVGVTTTSYVDHGALPDRTYFYVITALDGSSNESAISEERMIGPIPTGEAGREEAGRLVGR
jgi:hypothetical protein